MFLVNSSLLFGLPLNLAVFFMIAIKNPNKICFAIVFSFSFVFVFSEGGVPDPIFFEGQYEEMIFGLFQYYCSHLYLVQNSILEHQIPGHFRPV